MKTTLEIPDRIFRRAKAKAAEQNVTLRQFVSEAVAEKLKAPRTAADKPWMKHIGKLKHLRKETVLINKAVEETFEHIDAEMWD